MLRYKYIQTLCSAKLSKFPSVHRHGGFRPVTIRAENIRFFQSDAAQLKEADLGGFCADRGVSYETQTGWYHSSLIFLDQMSPKNTTTARIILVLGRGIGSTK